MTGTMNNSLGATHGQWLGLVEHGGASRLGAALVAILRGRLEGARATVLEVEGIGHEFDANSPLWETVSELVLNLRSLAFDIGAREGCQAWVDVVGPCAISSSDFSLESGGRVLGRERVLAAVPEGHVFRGLLRIEKGRGLRIARSDSAPGTRCLSVDAGWARWDLDAFFGPVLDARFDAKPASDAKSYGPELLTVELRLDGSIEPVEALRWACATLAEQLSAWAGDAFMPSM